MADAKAIAVGVVLRQVSEIYTHGLESVPRYPDDQPVLDNQCGDIYDAATLDGVDWPAFYRMAGAYWA